MEERETEDTETFGLSDHESSLLDPTEGSDFADSQSADLSSGENAEEPAEESVSEETSEKAPEEAAPEPEKADDHKVPVSVLKQEREERRKWRDKANEVQGQLNMVLQALQGGGFQNQSGQKEEQVYDPKTQPLEYIQQQMASFQEAKRQMDEFNHAQAQAAQQQQVEREVASAWTNSVRTAKSEIPDIEDATKYLIDKRSQQLRELMDFDEAQIENTIRNEVVWLVAKGQEIKGSPAKFAYELAKSYGYTPTVSKISMKESVARAKEATNKTKSLTSMSGTPTADGMTLEMLDKMSEKEFNNWIEKNPRKYEKILMGAG